MKLSLVVVGAMLIALLSTASGLQVVDSKEYTSAFVNGEFVGTFLKGDPLASQAGADVSEPYVIVLTEFGTLEFVPKGELNAVNAYEGVLKTKIGSCMDDAECYNLAKDYCPTQNTNWVAIKPCTTSLCISGTNCFRSSTQEKTGTPGYCNAECVPSQTAGVCNSVTCHNDMSCPYGTKSNAYCGEGVASSRCVTQKCYTYDEGVVAGTVKPDSFCSSSMTSSKLSQLCEARCNDLYSSKFHATSASCRSTGELVCGCQQERTIECTGTSGCNALATAKCGSLAEVASGYPKCDIERTCGGSILAANCLAPCKTEPTVVIPIDQIVDFVCGNGNCETPGETKYSCPLDCGSVSVNPSPTCTPGTRQEFKCSGGKRLLQKSVFSSCVEQWSVIQECPEICSAGACIAAPTGSVTDPTTGTITLPGDIEVPPAGTDLPVNATLPPELDDPQIIDYCGDGFCDPTAGEDKTCISDCKPGIIDIGTGSGEDNTIIFIILLTVVGGIALLAWLTMRK